MKNTFFTVLAVFFSFIAFSQIEGKWKTVDDETGEKKAVVQIYKKKDGKYYGRILEMLKELPFDTCEKCAGDLKGKPVIGLEFIQGMEKSGDEWINGIVHEPKSGKSYNCKAKLTKSGGLELRAYLGMPFIGRTQTWIRM